MNDAAACRRIVRTHARTFWLASRFLPAEKRRAAFALYAFCRVADDIVDATTVHRDQAAEELSGYRRTVREALEGQPDGPVLRELAEACVRFSVPARLIDELLDGVGRDCAPVSYATWDDLAQYCGEVASSVGEMCTHVFGVDGGAAHHARAVDHARTLGVAMQLTNVLRDVGEDARRGRCYLPAADLAQFGLSRDLVLEGAIGRDPRWQALMRFEITRARALYERAMPGILLLRADARRCATACAVGYAAILEAIERQQYDTFGTRARLSQRARARVLWNALRHPISAQGISGDAETSVPRIA